jgi:STE24 endopeptidase
MWAFIFSMQIIFLTVYPIFVAPLFDNYAHLQDGSLRGDIEKLTMLVNFPLRNIFVVNSSIRGGHSSAYMYGFGRNKRLVLHDTLLKRCSNAQVAAVVAHELGHWKLGHTVRLACMQQIIMLVQFSLFAVIRMDDRIFIDVGFDSAVNPSVVSLIVFMTIMGPIDKIVSWIFNVMSRKFEFEADAFALTLVDSKQLIGALDTIDKHDKKWMDMIMDPLFSQCHHSHPPIAERRRAIAEVSSGVT